MKKIIIVFCLVFFTSSASNAKEVKFGIMQHDFDTKLSHRHEKGQNFVIEYMFDKMQNYLRAHPHIGASFNNKGYTSNIYAGLTWQFILKNVFLVEASLGASLNNAEKRISKKRRALGSKLLFRESFSLGYLIGNKYSITVMIDHISSADIKKPNPGLTDIGIRLGYKL